MNVTHRLQAAFLAALVATASCSPPSTTPRQPSPPPSARPQPREPTLEPWPFTVDEVLLSCEPAHIPARVSGAAADTLRRHGSRVFVTAPNGRRYAVNGTARSAAPLMRDIQAQVDLRPLIQLGLSLCRDGQPGALRLHAPPSAAAADDAVAYPPPRHWSQPSPIGSGRIYIVEADQIIDGRRPTLSFSCSRERPPMVMLNLLRAPRTPPPFRDVYAIFQTGNKVRRIEMSWGLDAMWTLRSDDQRRIDRELVGSILARGRVSFRGDRSFMPRDTLTWSVMGFDLDELRNQCA